jgi:LPXTG-motif cell wall-anchored protein
VAADDVAVLSATATPSAEPQVLPPVAPQAPSVDVLAAQDDGALPETGSDPEVLLAVAAAAALGGLVFLGFSRRRPTP